MTHATHGPNPIIAVIPPHRPIRISVLLAPVPRTGPQSQHFPALLLLLDILPPVWWQAILLLAGDGLVSRVWDIVPNFSCCQIIQAVGDGSRKK